MKTMYRLVVSPRPITDEIIEKQTNISEFLSILGTLEIITDFYYHPEILDGAILEKDDDLNEAWLKAKFDKVNYHWIHLVLNEDDWEKAGIRESLYGQSRIVSGQVITYGRWEEGVTNSRAYRYESPVNELSEQEIGTWHEGMHGFTKLFKILPTYAYTHYYFYGYKSLTLRKDEDSAERWVRTPQPILGWRSLPWGRLPELETRKPAPIEDYDLIIKQKDIGDLYWNGNQSKALVLHSTRGDDSGLGSIEYLKQKELSYHFIVTADGTVYQLVPFGASAWHAGIVHEPTEAVRKCFGSVNPNKLSIGIAFARNKQEKLTDAQVGMGTALIKYIGQHTGTYYTHENIFAHCEITSYKPLEVLNYKAQILKALAGEREPTPVDPTPVPDPEPSFSEEKRQEIIEVVGAIQTLLAKLLAKLNK